MTEAFELKAEHIKLAEKLNFGLDITTEYNGRYAVRIDRQRPFGNSGCLCSAVDILYPENDWDSIPDSVTDHVEDIIIELPVALEIMLKKHTFTPGIYLIDKYGAWLGMKRVQNYKILLPACAQVTDYAAQVREICMNITSDDPYDTVIDELCEIASSQTGKSSQKYIMQIIQIFRKEAEAYKTKALANSINKNRRTNDSN